MPELHETQMGQRFYLGTMPSIQHALERIAEALEGIESKLDKKEEEMEQ